MPGWGVGTAFLCSSLCPPSGCYPFYKSDPFILTHCPHVYFCGNAPSFRSKLLHGESHCPPLPCQGCQGALLHLMPTLSSQERPGRRCCW